VIGKVVLEAGASVWFASTLRGDNEEIRVGAGSNVQENCVFHTDLGFPLTIGAGCTIGHKVMLHGCTIGRNSLIGMGATILNGAKIGNNCLIGRAGQGGSGLGRACDQDARSLRLALPREYAPLPGPVGGDLMPHAELHYSSDIRLDAPALLQEIEDIILRHDAGAGQTKGRAYPRPICKLRLKPTFRARAG